MFVSDSTLIIAYARVDRLDIVQSVLNEIVIPTAVFNEIRISGMPGASEVQSERWITRRDISDTTYADSLPASLGLGERHAISLARQRNAVLVTDDRPARRVATAASINVIGSITVLTRAKKNGLIGEVKPLLDDMIMSGYRVSKSLYQQSLFHVGE